MSITLSRERQLEIDALGQALKEGAWTRLNRLARKCGLPQKQQWRLDLWQAATGLSPGRLDNTLQAWKWLRSHGMVLDHESSEVMVKHIVAGAPAADVSPLLNAFVQDHDLPDPLILLDAMALARLDPAALAWLYDRGVPLDPEGPKGRRVPTLQRVLENLGTQPATHDVLSWLIDHGVQVRTPHTVYGIKGASPLGFLIGTVQNQDMSCPTWLTCATQLWELLEAAGDDPHTAVGNLRSPVNRLATVPPLQKWYEGRNLARQRQEQASAVVGAQRRRLRS